MKKITFGLFALLLFAGGASYGQDPQFSQFYASPVLLNPAFAGSGTGPRIALNFRNQWPSIPGSFKTFAAAFDMPFYFGGKGSVPRHGLGVSFLGDQAGEGNLTKLQGLVNYAFMIPLGRNEDSGIRFGLAGGFQQSSVDLLKLRFPNQYDPITGYNEFLSNQEPGVGKLSRITPEVTAGALYFNRLFYIGSTVHHIVPVKEEFLGGPQGSVNKNASALPIRIDGYAGVNIPLDRKKEGKLAVSPAVMFRYQGPFTQLDMGVYFNVEPVVFGVWYRGLDKPDAIIGLVGIRKGMFSFAYSYDYTISTLTNKVSGGAHEVSLTVQFDESKRNARKKNVKMSCPKF